MSLTVAPVYGLWDTDDKTLKGLIQAANSAYADRIVFAQLTAAQSSAGAAGIAALNAGQTGLLKIDGTALALGNVDTVAGIGATNRDVPVSDLAAAIQVQNNTALDITWAALATTNGSYTGQRKRLPSLDGVGFVHVEWNGTKWDPVGVQTLFDYDRVAGTTGTTAGVTIPTVSFKGGPFWKKTKLDISMALTSSVNANSAAPVLMALGALNLINDTTQPSRAKSFSRVINLQDDAVQYCFSKLDNQYSSYANLTSGALAGTVALTSDFSLTASTSTGWVNASSHTMSLEQYRCLWYR